MTQRSFRFGGMRCGNSGSTIVRLNQIIVFSFYLRIKLDIDKMTDKSLVLEQDKHQFSKERKLTDMLPGVYLKCWHLHLLFLFNPKTNKNLYELRNPFDFVQNV